MTISKILTEQPKNAAFLIRQRERGEDKVYQYDVKPLFTGSKRGWVVLDAVTASMLRTVYCALRDDLKPSFDRIQLHKLIDFGWKHVR